MGAYSGLFQRYQPLQGRDWVKNLPDEDRRVFVDIGLQAADHGKLGGVARAAEAQRDNHGRFARQDGTNKRTGEDPRKGTREDVELWNYRAG
jgi:hypothetical protein